ncbi:MAG: bifunctional YncE family protein/alkaline phosphatase family protein [Candidatus Sulfotelmatobacter sp.]|jgi:YVTN family beta-propeller protein
MRRLPLLVGLTSLLAALSVSAFAQSQEFPTYVPGENQNALTGPTYSAPLPDPWVVSDGTIITPVGTQVYLGITTRAKAVALNPSGNGTAAVLQMGAPQSVSIFCVAAGGCDSGAYTQGEVMQNFSTTLGNHSGSSMGVAYSPNGAYLLFSEDGNYGPAYVGIASVNPSTGLLSNYTQVSVPLDVAGPNQVLTNVTCYPYNAANNPPSGSPPGTTGSIEIPCGQTVSLVSDGAPTSYPMGIAVAPNSGTAYVVLDNNDTITSINLTGTPVEGPELRVGQVPNNIVINSAGTYAYVANEAGKVPTASSFQGYSNGTPVVAVYPTGSTSDGTISVVDLSTFKVTKTITVGLHPTGMAFWGTNLLVVNTYDDTISVINTSSNTVTSTIKLDPFLSALGVTVPGNLVAAVGPNSIAVDNSNNGYVALYNANAVAVIDLNTSVVQGLIPVGYAPSSVVFDATDGELLVANDKGLGTTGYGVSPPPTNTFENSYAKEFGVVDFETHQDLGTVSIIPIASLNLPAMTTQVIYNNHWDLTANIASASGGRPSTPPVAIPAKIGAPSLIKHVFLIIRENRTYDQILGDVAAGNGDASLAVFGDSSTYTTYPVVTPNAHSLVERFPLLDNYYNPSRQSADGHNWITQAMAPYSDDIQSPDWLRDYPSNGGEALAYQKAGHLWDQAAKYHVSFKNYGEYIEYNTFLQPGGSTAEPLWIDFFNDITCYEAGKEPQLYNYNTVASHSPLPNLIHNTYQTYPQFDLGIPDQFRFDIWNEDFQADVTSGTVPQLEFMWISSDHTGGPPNPVAMQADNDLALGRFVDAISHSSIWSSSAIFVTEDDAQTGVDHVDGHRSPGYIISPYVIQSSGDAPYVDSTFYTQVNMTRTIEQILGIKPMNQNDLVASPMSTVFIDNPPADNFLPWTHVATGVPLTYGVSQTPTQTLPPSCSEAVKNAQATNKAQSSKKKESPAVKALRAGWMAKKAEIFAGNYHRPDVEDSDTVNHLDWYEATGFTRPYPGESKVRSASEFNRPAPNKVDDDD